MYKYFGLCSFSLLCALSSCSLDSLDLPEDVAGAYNSLPNELSYNYDIKPILSDKCFACHGPDANKREAKLRLDLESDAKKALGEEESYYAIKSGSVTNSTLVTRILSNDPDMVMPTPESHLSLTVEEKAKIIKWIDEGAVYEEHWAFIPPENPKLPSVENEKWVQNPIDNFILSKLESKEVDPAERATKESLIRRASFSLRGLPPSLQEIDAFTQNTSPDAYQKVIDDFLASAAYGERMASDWLDIARYADSDGYLDDKHRDFSPYRDWVIGAFNQNMDYKTFITWQLAGDLIPNKSKESILATAFNRLHKKNSEAGIIYEEFRTEYVADRTLTLGKAVLGLSVECARCHDHKYDPISQKEYYSLFAFFNSTHEIGTAVYGPAQTPGPSLLLSSNEEDELIDFIKNKISQTEEELTISSTKALEEGPKIELNKALREKLVVHYDFENFQSKGKKNGNIAAVNNAKAKIKVREPSFKKGRKGKALFLNEFTNAVLPKGVGWYDQTDPFSVALSLFPDTSYQEVNIFSHAEDDRLGLKGYSLFLTENRLKFVMAYSYPQNAIEVLTKTKLPIKKWSDVVLTYDGSGLASGVGIYIDGKKQELEIRGKEVYKSILFESDIHTYGFSGLQLGVVNRIVNFKNGGIDELKVFGEELSSLEALHLHNPVLSQEVLLQQGQLVTEHQKHQRKQKEPLYKSLKTWRDSLTQLVNGIPEIMVMGDLPVPRVTHVLDRGAYDAPTDEVQPDGLDAVLPFDDSYPKNRLGLTQWLFEEKNPMTARVFVNRIWAMHFGEGLVKTLDDFGNQGSMPTHPKLLDYLSIYFVESGWDIKALHKLILSSATYQQSAVFRKDLEEIDPYNSLLARGPSLRFTAEMVRDNALAVSGLLVDKLGGESAFPYQPEGLWDEISNKVWRYKYLQEPGEGLYRRSLYTVWKRSSPPPSMMVFDAGDRSVCTVKRQATSTPLQALVLLNDPQTIEAACVLAHKLTGEEEALKPRLSKAFKTLLGRLPTTEEMSFMQTYFKKVNTAYAKRPNDAIAFLSTGEWNSSEVKEPVEVAATAMLIHGLMNTSEGFTHY